MGLERALSVLQPFLVRQLRRIIRHGLVLLGLLGRANNPTKGGPACPCGFFLVR
jgi:hypothetical protein